MGSAVNTIGAGVKNKCINGNFDFWQRGTTFNALTNTSYSADRWWGNNGAVGTMNVTRQSVLGVLTGSQYCARIEKSAGAAGTFGLCHNLENAVALALRGRTVTASFWVRKSATMTSGITVSFGSTTSETRGTAFITSNTLSITDAQLSSSVFQRFTLSVVIPSNDTGAGFQLSIIANSIAGAAGVYFEVGQVMIHEGATIINFELSGGSMGGELSACQRFYEKSYPLATAPGANGSESGMWAFYAAQANLLRGFNAQFKVPKRATPTFTPYSFAGTPNQVTLMTQASPDVGGTLSFSRNSEFACEGIDTTSGITTGSYYWFNWTADAEI